MATEIYRYDFEDGAPTEDVEASLLLAAWGCEALHGEAQVNLDGAHFFDPAERVCIIDASTPVGRDFNRLFVGFIRREFDADAFRVRRISRLPVEEPAAA